jgi:NAD(P)H-flavin reductase
MLLLLCVRGVGGILERPQMWKWLLGPLTLYALDRVARMRMARRSECVIVRAAQFTDRTLEITLACQPPHILDDLQLGDYIYVAVNDSVATAAGLSRQQWHPFSVMSGPSERPQLRLLIELVGDWTSAMQRLVNPLDVRGDLSVVSLPHMKVTFFLCSRRCVCVCACVMRWVH